MGDEKRGDPRITHAFMVRYRAPDAGQPTWLMSPLRDISSGGARFVSESTFAEGALLEMQLVLPTYEKPVVIAARIAWARPGPMAMQEYGVTFAVDDPVLQQAIDTAVAHFLKK